MDASEDLVELRLAHEEGVVLGFDGVGRINEVEADAVAGAEDEEVAQKGLGRGEA